MNDSYILNQIIPEAEAAKATGESARTWERRRRTRTGPAFITIGRKIFYRPDAIEEWLLSNEQQPAS